VKIIDKGVMNIFCVGDLIKEMYKQKLGLHLVVCIFTFHNLF